MADQETAPSRRQVLALLHGQSQRPELARLPCFSGLISVTESGLQSLGLRFSDAHHDAQKMALAAATSFRLFGFEAAVAPLDLCVEAEALGSRVDFRFDALQPEFPTISQPAFADLAHVSLPPPGVITERGRLPLVREAIGRLQQDVGGDVVVGAWVPGPFTLAQYVVDPQALLMGVVEAPEQVDALLASLAALLAEVALAYRAAGADFLTIHDMGGSPGYVGPRTFKRHVRPALQQLAAALPAPRVLSICGQIGRALAAVVDIEVEAVSVDHVSDLGATRQALPAGRLLFGNIDPVATLAQGSPALVTEAVRQAAAAGVDAIWPGCDLWPPVPPANMEAMVAAAGHYSRSQAPEGS